MAAGGSTMKPSRSREPEPDPEQCLTMARSCLSASLRRTERLVTRHYDAHLAGTGVTAAQLPILATIHAAPEPTFRLLAEQLDLDRSTLSRNLSLLERRGLLEIGASSGPKPALLALTRKGREALRRAHVRWTAAHRELDEALATPTLTRVLSSLKAVRKTARQVSSSS
jgi:DNA-binding MarR family transcriptional regulator